VSLFRRLRLGVFRPSRAFLDWAQSPGYWSVFQLDLARLPAKTPDSSIDTSRD